MSPDEWAEVFRAGWQAIPSATHPPADALARALAAMARMSTEIGQRDGRQG